LAYKDNQIANRPRFLYNVSLSLVSVYIKIKFSLSSSADETGNIVNNWGIS
jgi:hypothetical protein